MYGRKTLGILGAGTFIDRILVTENVDEGRQYHFQCHKWLDSGQVDGRLERVLKLNAFYELATMPEDNRVSSTFIHIRPSLNLSL